MRLLFIFVIFCFLNIAFAKDELLDEPINLEPPKGCSLSEFCEKFINDINIEKYIQERIKNDYVHVSLDECIDIALANNFNMRISDCDYLSSRYEYQNALSKFLPLLSTTSYLSDFSGQILIGGVLRDVIHETALSVNITAEHELTQGGRQIFEAKAKKYFSKAKKHDFNYSQTEAIYYTTRYYYEMLLAKLNIEIYLRNLIERNAQLELAKKLEHSGFGTKFDVIRSKNESEQAKVSLLNSLNEFRLSQTRLANVMGIEVDTALMPVENEVSPLKLTDENLTLNDFFKLAIENREDLKSYSDLIAYEKQIKNVYITDFIPKPLINFQQQFQGTLAYSVKPNYIVSAFMSWAPGENCIWGTVTKIKAQKEKIKSRTLEFQNKLRNIEQALVESYSTTSFNKKEIEITKKRVEYSNAGVRLAMLRFNSGKGILLDVIQAQSQVTQARTEYVNAVIKYNISQAQLLFNSGTISKEIIFSNYNP